MFKKFKREFVAVAFNALLILILYFSFYTLMMVMKDDTIKYSKALINSNTLDPSLQSQLKDFPEKLKDYTFFTISQWYQKNLGQFVGIISILLAFQIFARETERKTWNLFLAISRRTDIFYTKYFAGLIVSSAILFIFDFIPFLFGKNLDFLQVLPYIISHFISMFFWFNITILISIISGNSLITLFGTIGIYIVITILGNILPALFYLSVYDYAITPDKFPFFYPFLLIIISCITLYQSYRIFLSKDF